MAQSHVEESDAEIYRELEVKLKHDDEVRRKSLEFAEEVVTVAKLQSPVRTGFYRDSWHVETDKDKDGMPAYRVVNDDPKANMIEFGTGPDKPGGHSPFGPNTPTPAFAVAAQTALHFDGTGPDGVSSNKLIDIVGGTVAGVISGAVSALGKFRRRGQRGN